MSLEFPSSCERFVESLIAHIQPAKDTELQRWEVVQHLQAVLYESLRCQPFLFGSVAYKTYLPDGDIDVTVPCPEDVPHLEQLELIKMALESCPDGDKRPRNVTIIDANVKVMKMVLNGFYVDISINQTGGLTTLCFLQEVDNAIGRNHLFKRALLLVKAWCHYESDIMGSGNGLIGTYALTTMLLAIFNLFDGIDTPLKAFYQFLAYYSIFNLEEYVITMYGPQLIDRHVAGVDRFPIPTVRASDGVCSFPLRDKPLIPYDLPQKWQAEWGDGPIWTPLEPPASRTSAGVSPQREPLQAEDSPRSEEEKDSEDTSIGSLSGDSKVDADETFGTMEGSASCFQSLSSAVTSEHHDDWRPHFQFRSVNVQDPLRPLNNLGRSITKCNAIRVRRALQSGFRSLVSVVRMAQGGLTNGVEMLHFFPHLIHTCGLPPDLVPPIPGGNSLFDRIADPRPCHLPLCAQCHRPVGTSIFCIDLDNLKANLTRSRERPKSLRAPRMPWRPPFRQPRLSYSEEASSIYPFPPPMAGVVGSAPMVCPSAAPYLGLWQGEASWSPYLTAAHPPLVSGSAPDPEEEPLQLSDPATTETHSTTSTSNTNHHGQHNHHSWGTWAPGRSRGHGGGGRGYGEGRGYHEGRGRNQHKAFGSMGRGNRRNRAPGARARVYGEDEERYEGSHK